jgi:hypothetical protein
MIAILEEIDVSQESARCEKAVYPEPVCAGHRKVYFATEQEKM